MAAVASQATRFVEFDYVSVNATSLVEPHMTIVSGCQYSLTPFIARYEQVRESKRRRRRQSQCSICQTLLDSANDA